MHPTPTLSAFIVERGRLLAEAVAELGAQFALPAECVHLSVRPALCAAQGDLAELDELLHESLPDLDGGPDSDPTGGLPGGLPGSLPGDPSGAPALVPLALQVVSVRLLGLSRSVGAHVAFLSGPERLAVDWLAHRAAALSQQAARLSVSACEAMADASASLAPSVAQDALPDVGSPFAQTGHRGTTASARPETSTPVEAAA
ncbi:hypothetical protein RVX_R18110 [Nitratidesulfovibrio sp. HK-II]|uniref:hypothetical protein n=1 Tax=Nitratidesulfovibrio sp. HK-II TaxID=2009266 RepID=UPI000E2FF2C3|nr:hypothetical protein [Nitratidesulfovibrio sp. HK-II]GBO96146.1 hypothetical protein RVX_1186 [Nitratidesulfovibrio sp. HK-II]